ncbi:MULTISPECIES: hypothetical protein [unclassified Streptomyces]|uniref:hypothetical protein n=1 Tax=Streptomyces sp. SYP-A7185 TaxID=3040076 RepID=UPI0038F60658
MDSEAVPDVGAVAVDTATGRVGVVMEKGPSRVYLRPPGGGKEWEAEQGSVRRADRHEELQVKVARVNAESRWPR